MDPRLRFEPLQLSSIANVSASVTHSDTEEETLEIVSGKISITILVRLYNLYKMVMGSLACPVLEGFCGPSVMIQLIIIWWFVGVPTFSDIKSS